MFSVLFLIIYSLNTFLHTSGFILLMKCSNDAHRSVQHLYITNLSASELFRNVLMLTGEVFIIIRGTVELEYVMIIIVVGCTTHVIYSLAKLFLSLDRMLTAVIGERYTETWSKSKTLILVTIKWLAALMIGSSACIYLYKSSDIQLTNKVLEYFSYLDIGMTLINGYH